MTRLETTHFIVLRELYISDTGIGNLVTVNLTKLQILNARATPIKSLDARPMTKLTTLKVGDSGITELTLNKSNIIQILDADETSLKLSA